jgi:Ni/Fe-hydrogenase subunit HybB-like protein
MLEDSKAVHLPVWKRPPPQDPKIREQVEQLKEQKLLLDVREPGYMDELVMRPAYTASPKVWIGFLLAGLGLCVLGGTWLWQMIQGLGITGLTRPNMWAVYIVTFVYFIGIGHAGTFISAAFRALKIQWRAPISRPAELLTVFGLSTAGLFPLIHLGRTWKGFWLIPYPNERQIWPSFHSPLVWDLVAITTYLTCSALFAYIALIPDLAMARDRETRHNWRKRLYEIASLGWRGTEHEWHLQETASNVFTYAIIPVMFSVHTVVSWDFAMALQPGWHSTIFGPYFVVGALFSGVAAVIIIMTILRKYLHMEYFLREEHFNGMAIFLLILSFSWAYFYFNDYLVPWYGAEPPEKLLNSLLQFGRFAPFWWLMIFSNIILPWAILWNRKWRTNRTILLIVAIFVNIGMYMERVIIVPIGLTINLLPYNWGIYWLQLPETLIVLGSFCLVIFLFFLFARFFPLIAVWEVKEGQEQHQLRQTGRAVVDTRTES